MAGACRAAGAALEVLARGRGKLQAVAEETGAFPLVVDVSDGAAVACGVALAGMVLMPNGARAQNCADEISRLMSKDTEKLTTR